MNIRLAMAILISLSLASSDLSAQCMRLVPKKNANDRPEFDGPGAFGPLHDTVTLGCLRFTGFISLEHSKKAQLVDEAGATYSVREGDYVGENDGRISEIAETRITIVQFVKNADNKLVEVTRYLFLVDAR